jgi:hypothetical protein
MYDLTGKRVFVAGHRGMVGGALVRRLADEGCEVITAGRGELDLTDQRQTFDWVASRRPDAIFMAAAKVGGIMANATYPAQFLYQNLVMQASTPNSRTSRSRKARCSPARSSRPTNGMRSPRSPASSWARRTAPNMAATSSRQCRPTSTESATISTCRPAMSSPR